VSSSPVPRPLPVLNPQNEFYWTSGRDGRLRVLRCARCGTYLHPPAPVCPACLSAELAPVAVSGRGTVYTFTVNMQQWQPGLEVPYVVALVELVEQEGLRILTNIVGCEPDEVVVGMAVEARFEHHGDVYVPLFGPVAA
jgi:uncharacterized OB-fold protein